MIGKVKLVGNRILIKPDKETEIERSSGIVLPETFTDDNPTHFGTVFATGPGIRTEEGRLLEPIVKPGDTVIYLKHQGIGLDLDGETYYVINEGDIICIVK